MKKVNYFIFVSLLTTSTWSNYLLCTISMSYAHYTLHCRGGSVTPLIDFANFAKKPCAMNYSAGMPLQTIFNDYE